MSVLPQSSVPAAFDRGHLYSPTLNLTKYALDDRYVYDYLPGDLYEPMPGAPRGNPKAWAWWWQNIATTPVPDFLGLRVGDRISVQHVTCTAPAKSSRPSGAEPSSAARCPKVTSPGGPTLRCTSIAATTPATGTRSPAAPTTAV
ncbi:hypothetical protein [Streptomyces sp. NPDC053726]|uniref:hypothetical protein n=1 Tax=Streptomyces sp. NPDC053726 TaxID=3365713 RepID=UPI0037D4E1E9